MDVPPAVEAALAKARALGFLGEGPIEVQLEHAAGFRAAAESAESGGWPDGPAAMLDLGSGGGIPGLVLAAAWPDARVVLLDANDRRCSALREAVTAAGWEDRVQVVQARAEQAGRDPDLRGTFDLVVARSFAPPPVTAECAAPFLRVTGLLIVSEPPSGEDRGGAQDGSITPVGHPDRWPSEFLAGLGLEPLSFFSHPFAYQVLRQVAPCPERYPRREGVPAKRPLY